MKHILLWLALLLFIAWIIFRLVVVVTSVFLNLLWIIALLLFLIWIVKRLG